MELCKIVRGCSPVRQNVLTSYLQIKRYNVMRITLCYHVKLHAHSLYMFITKYFNLDISNYSQNQHCLRQTFLSCFPSVLADSILHVCLNFLMSLHCILNVTRRGFSQNHTCTCHYMKLSIAITFMCTQEMW